MDKNKIAELKTEMANLYELKLEKNIERERELQRVYKEYLAEFDSLEGYFKHTNDLSKMTETFDNNKTKKLLPKVEKAIVNAKETAVIEIMDRLDSIAERAFERHNEKLKELQGETFRANLKISKSRQDIREIKEEELGK